MLCRAIAGLVMIVVTAVAALGQTTRPATAENAPADTAVLAAHDVASTGSLWRYELRVTPIVVTQPLSNGATHTVDAGLLQLSKRGADGSVVLWRKASDVWQKRVTQWSGDFHVDPATGRVFIVFSNVSGFELYVLEPGYHAMDVDLALRRLGPGSPQGDEQGIYVPLAPWMRVPHAYSFTLERVGDVLSVNTGAAAEDRFRLSIRDLKWIQ